MKEIYGYKGMKSDMTCRGMQYEIGKSYHVDGKISLCQNGMHFCTNLVDTFDYYPNINRRNRFFLVEASGTIETGLEKCVTSDLRIIRELTDVEINRTDYGCGRGDGPELCYGDGRYCGQYGWLIYVHNESGSGYDHDKSGSGYEFGNGDGYGSGQGYGYDSYTRFGQLSYSPDTIERVLSFM